MITGFCVTTMKAKNEIVSGTILPRQRKPVCETFLNFNGLGFEPRTVLFFTHLPFLHGTTVEFFLATAHPFFCSFCYNFTLESPVMLMSDP